jgi:protein-L-isoaspartate O-methyltransferase
MEDFTRESLVELLEAEGVLTDDDVAEAMRSVAREDYFDERTRGFAYTLQEVPITEHVIALNPNTIAELLSVARPAPGMRVLLLGTSTGYVEALLTSIGCAVSVIEPNETQRAYAQASLTSASLDVVFIDIEDATTYDLVIPLKSVDKLDPRILGFTPYGRTMLVLGEDHALIALDYRGDPAHPDVSYSGSVWLPFFDPPLLNE